jgi:hypothetical protein
LVGAVVEQMQAPVLERKAGAATLRVIQAAVDIRDEGPTVAYQHTVLCQTCLPYRDPGDDVRSWDRDNGRVSLRLKAGEAMHPTNGWVDVGLPYGPKPRLILSYLNTQAIIHRSPQIEVEASLTAFVKRVGLDAGGRNIRTIKDQLARLAATNIKLGIAMSDTTATTVNTQIITKFDLWFPKDDRQRVLWPTSIVFSREYFDTLVEHAVPLDERALAALSHSAMALDVYAWLGQRMHRIHPREAAFIPWTALHRQFGQGYTERIRKFREVFLVALKQVLAVYPAAKLAASAGGLTLHHSAPPVPYRAGKPQLASKT